MVSWFSIGFNAKAQRCEGAGKRNGFAALRLCVFELIF
jgi:hypothetical protein